MKIMDKICLNPLKIGSLCNMMLRIEDDPPFTVSIPLKSGHYVIFFLYGKPIF